MKKLNRKLLETVCGGVDICASSGVLHLSTGPDGSKDTFIILPYEAVLHCLSSDTK